MPNNATDKDAMQDELNNIRTCLMEPKYHPLPGIPHALRLMEEMLSGSHPSGHPDPVTLACVAGYIRDEKFRERREKHTDTPLTKDLQRLIDRVKTLKVQAELARPRETLPSGWRHRHWEGGMIDVMSSIIVLTPYFILLISLSFTNIPAIWNVVILSSYLALSTCISIAMKLPSLLLLTLFLFLTVVPPVAYILFSPACTNTLTFL